MEEVILTEEQLQERLQEWQKRLRLQDWIITAKIKRARELMDETQATVSWQLAKKMAMISIMDPIDYPPDSMEPQDMENSLVHELLHLHFAPLNQNDDDERYHIGEEQAIESIASGLINAARLSIGQVPTAELANELAKRKGVTEIIVNLEEESTVNLIKGAEVEVTHVSGPARILVNQD
jgi:hypothetical protein